MKEFEYVVKDKIGIHARPASMLAKEAQKYKSKIMISSNGKTAEMTRVMALMGMGVKCEDTVTVTFEGEDEETACEGMKAYMEANL